MRIQTFYLLDIQIPRKSKFDYKHFKNQYMSFVWDKDNIRDEDELEKIDWDALDKRRANINANPDKKKMT